MRRSVPILVACIFGAALLLLLNGLPDRATRRTSESTPRPTKPVALSPADTPTRPTAPSPAAERSAAPLTSETVAPEASRITVVRVRGRIVDPDGNPVPRATVRLHDWAPAGEKPEPRSFPRLRVVSGERPHRTIGETTSGAGGIFEIEPATTTFVLPKLVCLSAVATVGTTLATCPGDVTRDYALLPASDRARNRRLSAWSYGATFSGDVDRQGVLDVGDLKVRPRCVVTLRVREHGRPLAGLPVKAEFGSRSWLACLPDEDATDRDGVARFDGPLRDDASMILTFEKPGFALESRSIPLGSATAEVDIDLVPEAIVEGHVRDAHGEPVAGAIVFVNGGGKNNGLTDERGHYRIRGVGPGKVRLDVWPADGDDELARESGLTVVAPTDRADVTLEAAARVAATVTVPPGTRVAVHLITRWRDQDESGDADDAGAFAHEFRRVHSGPVRVLARASGFAPTLSPSLEARAGETLAVPLTLHAGRTVRGKTLDEKGQPVCARAVFHVDGVPIELDRPARVIEIAKDGSVPKEPPEDGHFELDELPLEEVEVVFSDGARTNPKKSKPIKIPSGVTELVEPVVLSK